MLKKKIIAVFCAAALAAGLAGCTDMSKIMTVDGEGLNAGVYINNMLSEYSVQSYYSQYFSNGDTDTEFLEKEYEEGKTYSEHFKEYALQQTLRGVAADKLFKDAGLELSEDDKKEIADNAQAMIDNYGEDYLNELGISKESVEICYTYSKENELLFDHYYGNGGTEEVKDDDIKSYLDDNYLRYKMITISKAPASTSGETATDEEKEDAEKKAKELADKYSALAEKNGADGFDEVIKQYNDETAEATTEAASEEETTEKADTTAEYKVTFVDSDGNEYDEDSDYPSITVKGGDKVPAPKKNPEKPYYDFSGWFTDAYHTTEYDFDSEVTGDLTLYAGFTTNEVLSQYDKDNATDIQKKIKELKVGTPTLESDDNNYYIILKLTPSEREDYMTGGSEREGIVRTMKTEDFNKKLDDTAKDMNIEQNDSAIDKYTPEKMESIMKKHASDN